MPSWTRWPAEYGDELEAAREPLAVRSTRQVFNHHAFTGRSGGMFGFEGLGCIYWHMVSKLLLAVQENFFRGAGTGRDDATICQRLGELYYRVREGIGFNKTPAEYGAFPTDPYSHTPETCRRPAAGHDRAGQGGSADPLRRTGRACRERRGALSSPRCCARASSLREPRQFRYLDVDGNWQEIDRAGATAWPSPGARCRSFIN